MLVSSKYPMILFLTIGFLFLAVTKLLRAEVIVRSKIGNSEKHQGKHEIPKETGQTLSDLLNTVSKYNKYSQLFNYWYFLFYFHIVVTNSKFGLFTVGLFVYLSTFHKYFQQEISWLFIYHRHIARYMDIFSRNLFALNLALNQPVELNQ